MGPSLQSRSPAIPKFSLKSEHGALWFCLLWAIVASFSVQGFFSIRNLETLAISLLPLLVLSSGQTIVLIAGGIDLSLAAVIGLASVAGASLIGGESPLLLNGFGASAFGVILMLGTGSFVGLLNGLSIAFFRMPPFMVTLATSMAVAGLATLATQSRTIGNLPSTFTEIGSSLPLALGLIALSIAAIHLLLSKTLFGHWIYAIGKNQNVANVSGVPVRATICLAYTLCGACGGIAAVLYSGRLASGSATHGQNMLLDVIGASVIGGASLFGGKGKVLWTIYGALFLTLIDNSLNLLNLSYFSIMMVKGIVILAAASLDTIRNRKSS